MNYLFEIEEVEMAIKKILIDFLFCTLSFAAFIEAANAAEATRSWGASSNVGTQLASSTGYHQLGGQSAQIVASGGDNRSINKSSTSCGVCIYNNNTGNNNVIEGNTSNSTNSGSVTSSANFNDTSLISTNVASNGANGK